MKPEKPLRLLRLVAEIERTRDPVDCGGETVRLIFAPSQNDPHQLRTLDVEAVELPRGGWSREEFNTLRDIQGQPPVLGYDWRDVVWTPERVAARVARSDTDADVLAAAEALATADAALQSAQPGSHDEDACELAREEAVTAILEAVAKRRPLEDPEPTMAPRKLGAVSLLGDGDGRPF